MTFLISNSALQYAARGWDVLPLHNPVAGGCSCQKGANCTAIGKHPRTQNGLKDATTDKNQITAWWIKWPDANLGIRTGADSGLLVVDIDGQAGEDSLAALAAQFGDLPDTLQVMTGKGRHLYFEHPGTPIANSVRLLGDGLDIRADNGYVVAPPSLHANLNTYKWLDSEAVLAVLPDGLLARITKQNKPDAVTESGHSNAFTEAPVVSVGSRNDTLYKLGCRLRGQQGMDRVQITGVLLEYNAAKCVPPLSEEEVTVVAGNACLHPAEQAKNKSAKRLEKSPLYWFPFNVRDWFSDPGITTLTDKQTGWHIRLLAFSWSGGGFLPANPALLWKLAGADSRKSFERDCAPVLDEYEEVQVDGHAMLKHAVFAAQYGNTLEQWMSKKDAGERGYAAMMQSAGNLQLKMPTAQESIA